MKFLAALACCLAAYAADWPQWRGPARDGAVGAPERPGPWPALSQVWERDAGHGYSGPIIAGDRVWIHARQAGKEAVLCLRLKDGEPVWRQEYAAPFVQDVSGKAHGEGPYSTPAVADGRLFTFGVNGVLHVWDAASGRLLWRRDRGAWPYPYFGAAHSPLVWNHLLFIHLGGHRRAADFAAAGAMVALREADGKEVWRWRGEPPCGASPVIASIGGQPHLVLKTLRSVFGLDPHTGRTLWRIPWPVDQNNTIVTPLFLGNQFITSDYEAGLASWRIEKQGPEWTARPHWRHRDASLFMSSPVLVNGVLAGFSHFRKGHLFGLDPPGGRLLWRGDPRQGEHASLVSWGRALLVFLENGQLLAGRVSAEGFRLERTYPLKEAPTWAHPAVTDTNIIIRAGSKVAAFAWKE
jgi:outer membrane protein assembly factor BamB